jgi:hypothetical protein
MLLTLTQVSAADQAFAYQEQNKLVTITYDSITVKVNAGGMVPKFQYIESNSGFEYNVQLKTISEYLDFNEDGAFQYNETAIWTGDPDPPMPPQPNVLALSSIRWVFSGFDVEYAAGAAEVVTAIHFSFVSDLVMVPYFGDLEMEIHAHMYLNDNTTDGYTVAGKTELKFDIVLRNWEWQRNDTNLALRFDIHPLKNTYRLNDTNGNACDTTTNTTGFETKVMNQQQVKQMYQISGEGVDGYFAYANKAQYKIASAYEYGTVNASHSSLGDGTLQTYLSFEHFDDELIYDPSVGVDEDTIDETGSIELVFIGVGALMVISFALYRKKNK